MGKIIQFKGAPDDSEFRPEDYLSVIQTAMLLGVSRDTIRRWSDSGKLKAIRHPINNYRLFHPKDVGDVLWELVGPWEL